MPRIIRQHIPLITSRIPFYLIDRPASVSPSVTTPRIDFGEGGPLPVDADTDLSVELEQTAEADAQHFPSHEPSDEREGAEIEPSISSNQSVNDAMIEDSDHNDGASETSSLPDSVSVDSDVLIPKPQGEPGRPRSGGYNLESQLTGWTPTLYKDVKVCPREAVQELELK